MKEIQTNTSITPDNYVEELKITDVDMIIYRMIGEIGAKLINI